MGAGATAALAVLVLGCAFAATAAPREALASRTQALQQTVTATLPLTRAITVSSTWSGISGTLAAAKASQPNGGFFSRGPLNVNITAGQLGEITSQLHDDFDRGVIHLAGLGQDWAGMITMPHSVLSSVPAIGGDRLQFEISYRQPLTQYTRLVAGRYPQSQAPAPTPASPRTGGAGSAVLVPVLRVVVSQQTARQFGLHPGSRLTITGPQLALSGKLAPFTLEVTGIVAPRDPASTFWTADPAALTPDLECPGCFSPPPLWIGEALAGPGEIGAMQQDFGLEGLNFQWEFPIGSLGEAPAQQLHDALNSVGAQTPALHGDVAPVAGTLQISTALLQSLNTFLSTAQAVDTLLWLLYVSLAVTGLVTLLLAARMLALRRSAELRMLRARGAALPQIALAAARGAAIACVPAAAAGVGLGLLAVPGPAPPGGWWPPACVLLVAICAPAVIGAWQQRLPRRRSRGRHWARGRSTRLTAELTACLAAIAAVVVFRQQGMQAGAGVNLYTSAAPVLIAVPAVIVVLRVYPLVLRGLLRGSARGQGATAFLGLARATRTRLTPALPAYALVLALTVAAFAGMVRDAVSRGEVAASWQATGADVSIAASSQPTQGATIPAAQQRAAAALPGVTHTAAIWQSTWSSASGRQVTVVAVDPASYAALVGATRTFPQLPAGLLRAGTPVPVLASPQAAAGLGAGVTTLTSQEGVAPVRIRVAGVLAATPAVPGVPTFVVIPVSAIHSTTTPPEPVPVNELLLTGANINRARLTAFLGNMLQGEVATVRSDILNGLTGAPLQHGAFVLFELSVAAAAVLGLAAMLFELTLGAAERAATLARLATMGLGEGQRVRVAALEVLPAVIAAAIAAGACALVLPRMVGSAIDLSVFTGAPFGGAALTPDVASFAVPLAALAVAAVLALSVEIRSGRRRGVAASLRVGG